MKEDKNKWLKRTLNGFSGYQWPWNLSLSAFSNSSPNMLTRRRGNLLYRYDITKFSATDTSMCIVNECCDECFDFKSKIGRSVGYVWVGFFPWYMRIHNFFRFGCCVCREAGSLQLECETQGSTRIFWNIDWNYAFLIDVKTKDFFFGFCFFFSNLCLMLFDKIYLVFGSHTLLVAAAFESSQVVRQNNDWISMWVSVCWVVRKKNVWCLFICCCWFFLVWW